MSYFITENASEHYTKHNRKIYTQSVILWLFLVSLGIFVCLHFARFTNPETTLVIYTVIVTYTVYKLARVLQATQTKALFQLNEYGVIDNIAIIINHLICIIAFFVLFVIGKKWSILIPIILLSFIPHIVAKYYLKKVRKLVEPVGYYEKSYDLRDLSEDDAQFVFNLEQSIAKEDPQYLHAIAIYLQNKETTPDNETLNLINSYLEKAAKKGYVKSCLMLGLKYLYGYGIAQNDALAFSWIQKAAMANNADAQAVLGLLYLGGIGVAQDKQTANDWYCKAAHQNTASAQYEFAWFLYFFASPEIDIHTMEWLPDFIRCKKESKFDFLIESFSLEKKQTEEVVKEAFDWCLKSAEQGHLKAQILLSSICFKNNWIPQNIDKGMYWQNKATEQLKKTVTPDADTEEVSKHNTI